MIPPKRKGLHLDRCHTGTWRYEGLRLMEEDILNAMRNSNSNAGAAAYLKISFPTYKKYAEMYTDPLTGKSLFELHKNPSSKGIKKKTGKYFREGNLDSMLTRDQVPNPKRIAKLKNLLIIDGRLGHYCHGCGYCQRRFQDNKIPLVIHFKDTDKTNWTLENLSFLCYNCAFQAGHDPFSNALLKQIESKSVTDPEVVEKVNDNFYEIDEFYMQHFENLGLLDGTGDVIEEKDPSDDKPEDPPELSLVSYV